MAVDFNKFGKSSKGGQQVTQPTSSYTSGTTSAPTNTSGQIDFNKFGKSGMYQGITQAPSSMEEAGLTSGFGGVGEAAKTILSPVVTMAARPIQLGAVIAGATPQQIEEKTSQLTGGIVAPMPQGQGKYGLISPSDLIKESGRAVQTVALGMPGLITGGATFGLGSTMERQGSQLFTPGGAAQGAFDIGTAAALSKLTGLIGKPIINKAGQYLGILTPQAAKDLASQGTQAVTDFMANHEIPVVGKYSKPISEAITQKAQALEEGIAGKTKELFGAAKQKAAKTIQEQYPTAKEDITKYYENSEVNKFFESVGKGIAGFKAPSSILEKAKARNIDLQKVLGNNKIYGSENVNPDTGSFDTLDTAHALRSDAASSGNKFVRPAFRAFEGESRRVTIPELRKAMNDAIDATDPATMSDFQKAKAKRAIEAEYGDNSPIAKEHPYGLTLTNLYDNKLQTASKVYKKAADGRTTLADSETANRKKMESQVFYDFLKERTPERAGLEDYFKAQEEKFLAADFLESLNGKKAPKTLFQRSLRKVGQISGATLGVKAGGPFGMFSGFQLGGIAADTFSLMPNPIKAAFLRSRGVTEAEIYQIMRQYTTDAEASRLSRQLLPGASNIDVGLSNLQNERGAIEMGYTPQPTTEEEKMMNNFVQNLRQAVNTQYLPAPGERMITPNTTGTPNPTGIPYSGTPQERVGGMQQRMTEDYTRSLNEWRASGTTEPYDVWMKDKNPDGTPKRLFKNETKKKIVNEPVQENISEPVKSKKSKSGTKALVGEKTKYVSPERDSIIENFNYYFEDEPPRIVNYLKTTPGKGTEDVYYRTSSNIPKNLPEEYRTRVIFNRVKPYWEAQIRPSKPGKTQELYDLLQKDVDRELAESKARIKEENKKRKSLKDYYEF